MWARGMNAFVLCIALVTGVVPLSVCMPTDGCHGNVGLVGTHGHDRHGPEGGGSGREEGCVDSAFPAGTPLPAYAHEVLTSVLASGAQGVLEPALEATVVADPFPPALASIPSGTRTVVLLR